MWDTDGGLDWLKTHMFTFKIASSFYFLLHVVCEQNTSKARFSFILAAGRIIFGKFCISAMK